jgi:hypothetical protein
MIVTSHDRIGSRVMDKSAGLYYNNLSEGCQSFRKQCPGTHLLCRVGGLESLQRRPHHLPCSVYTNRSQVHGWIIKMSKRCQEFELKNSSETAFDSIKLTLCQGA